MLKHGAGLNRHAVPHRGDRLVESGGAVDNQELRPPQTAFDEIVEHGAPGFGAFAARETRSNGA
jgi:hypothetical protein